jgi:hypothetical protein
MKYKKYRRKFEMPQEIDNIAVSVGKVCWQPSTNPNNLLLIGEAACCLLYARSMELSLHELSSYVSCCEFYYEEL